MLILRNLMHIYGYNNGTCRFLKLMDLKRGHLLQELTSTLIHFNCEVFDHYLPQFSVTSDEEDNKNSKTPFSCESHEQM